MEKKIIKSRKNRENLSQIALQKGTYVVVLLSKLEGAKGGSFF